MWPLIRAGIGVALAAAELAADTYERARRLGRRLLPRKREEAFPLTFKDVAHQQAQIRAATSKKN